MSHAHVIGAGLAGLSSALSLTTAGYGVTIYEAGPAAGGRCRSYYDRELGMRIDNGNHLLLSGNCEAMRYVREIGAQGQFNVTPQPLFPFLDAKTHEQWVLRPNRGRMPWWVFVKGRRVPGTQLVDYLRLRAVTEIRSQTTVAEAVERGALYDRLVEPLAIAALNTRPECGLASLLGTVMKETLLRGGKYCLPWLPKEGLSEALIDPAISALQSRGATVRFNCRIADMRLEGGHVTAFRGPNETVTLEPGDVVVLAVPPWAAAAMLPGLEVPSAFEAILNIHFAASAHSNAPVSKAGFIGITSGVAEWIFAKRDHTSVTISAANHLVDKDAAAIAADVWPDVKLALGMPAEDREPSQDLPPFRVVKEKRATFKATAQQNARRPAQRTQLATNLGLAGDWTETGLPATIEGAIRSGRLAAAAVSDF